MNVEIAKIDESVKSAHKRIDELQLVTKAFYDLASDVKVMTQQMINMKEDISEIKSKVEEKASENNRLAFNLKQGIINAIFMAIIGAVMALIIK